MELLGQKLSIIFGKLRNKSSHPMSSIKKRLNILQYSQQNTYVGDRRSATLLKRDSNTSLLLLILQNFKNAYFEEHLRTTASG